MNFNKKLLFLFSNSTVNFAVKFGYGIFLARNFEPTLFGVYALLLSYIMISFSFTMNFGHNFQINNYKGVDLVEFIAYHRTFRLIIGFAGFLALLGIYNSIGSDEVKGDKLAVILLALLFIAEYFNSIFSVNSSFLLRRNCYDLVTKYEVISVFGGLIAGIAGFYLLRGGPYELFSLGIFFIFEKFLNGLQLMLCAETNRCRYFKFDKNELRAIFAKGKYVAFSTGIDQFKVGIEKNIISSGFGLNFLAQYDRAESFRGLFNRLIAGPISTIYEYEFAKYTRGEKKLDVSVSEFIFSFLIIFGVLSGMYVHYLGPPIIVFILGENWKVGAELLGALAVHFAAQFVATQIIITLQLQLLSRLEMVIKLSYVCIFIVLLAYAARSSNLDHLVMIINATSFAVVLVYLVPLIVLSGVKMIAIMQILAKSSLLFLTMYFLNSGSFFENLSVMATLSLLTGFHFRNKIQSLRKTNSLSVNDNRVV